MIILLLSKFIASKIPDNILIACGNLIKTYFKILFSFSKYINNIFTNSSFKSLINSNPSKNTNFNSLLNKYLTQIKNIFQKYNNIIIYGNSTFFKSIEYLIDYNKIIVITDKNNSYFFLTTIYNYSKIKKVQT